MHVLSLHREEIRAGSLRDGTFPDRDCTLFFWGGSAIPMYQTDYGPETNRFARVPTQPELGEVELLPAFSTELEAALELEEVLYRTGYHLTLTRTTDGWEATWQHAELADLRATASASAAEDGPDRAGSRLAALALCRAALVLLGAGR